MKEWDLLNDTAPPILGIDPVFICSLSQAFIKKGKAHLFEYVVYFLKG